MDGRFHKPVLVGEVIASLRCRAGAVYVDGTVGGGGHALRILKNSAPDGRSDRHRRRRGCAPGSRETAGALRRAGNPGEGEFRRHGNDAVRKRRSERWMGSSSTWGSPPISWTRRRGDSASPSTPRWTCGWTGAGSEAPPISSTPSPWRSWRGSSGIRRGADGGENRPGHRQGEDPFPHPDDERSCGCRSQGAAPSRAERQRIHPATRTFQALRIAVNDELTEPSEGHCRWDGTAQARGTLLGHLLSFAGRPDRQECLPRRGKGMHLPPRSPRLRLRPEADD